jgi:hypothetical protein
MERRDSNANRKWFEDEERGETMFGVAILSFAAS